MRNLPDEIKLIEEQVLQAAHDTLLLTGKYAIEQAQSTTLFKHGNDFDQQIVFHALGEYNGEVVSEAEQSQYLEYGNDQGGPYIYPQAANVLHFFANGEEVFAKRVRSHGALPYMANAAEATQNEIENIFTKQFDLRTKT